MQDVKYKQKRHQSSEDDGRHDKSGNRKTPAAFIKPMLAELITKPFDDKNWVFEVKFDGYRTIAVVNNRHVDLFSRNQLSFNNKFKPIQQELMKITHSAVLDGEIVIEDDSGRSDFQLLQNYQRTGEGNIKYYVFDILNLDGNDTRKLTLLERKELLKMLIDKKFRNILYSEHISRQGKLFYETAVKNKFEGIMAKYSNSPYRSGTRSSEWLKIKITQEEEAIIVGITEGKGSRKYFGSILLAQYKGKELKYIGNCGTGFDEITLKELYSKFQASFTNTPTVKGANLPRVKIQWIEPRFVCQVRFTERTKEGSLRQPVYLGLRVDIKPNEVILLNQKKQPESPVKKKEEVETKESTKTGKENDFDLKIGKINIHLTNQNKIYFPGEGITKGEIVNYYKEIAEIILPYLKNRPQSLNRFPAGINSPGFFQKDVDVEKIPTWLKTKKIYSASNKDYIDYLLCNDTATLLYMANLGCIELNPWSSTVKNPEKPDWMVIDLDPVEVDFNKVSETAIFIKKLMDDLEIECYCKTSGSRGMHVYVPLGARYEYDTVKLFAKYIAYTIHEQLPDITSVERQPQKRKHKIYLDYLQNALAQTIAAPYSVRPKPGAPVSAPLDWNEVNKKLSPGLFTIKTMMKRLDKKGDLWKPVSGKGVDLHKLLKKLPE